MADEKLEPFLKYGVVGDVAERVSSYFDAAGELADLFLSWWEVALVGGK